MRQRLANKARYNLKDQHPMKPISLPAILILIIISLYLILVGLHQPIHSPAKKQLTTLSPTPAPTYQKVWGEKIDSYFKSRNCPLLGTGELMATEAMKYDLDFRLLPAIAMRESTGGKAMAGNNPFGFGYYRFNSIAEATSYVAQAISAESTPDAHYYLKAKKDPRQILEIYNTVIPGYSDQVLKIMEEISR